MNIKIVSIGKIKEQYLKDAIGEYAKRLTPFCGFSIVELASEQINEESLYEKYKKNEAQRILPYLHKDSFVITLEIKGKSLSSEGFAEKMKEISNSGYNEIVFVTGGANGLDESVSARADFKLSFSKMTFTHQLIRLVLVEQIYRSFKINNNEKYHR